MTPPLEAITTEALVEEMRPMGAMELQLQAATVLQLVALIQLSLRHPDAGDFSAAAAAGRQFIAAARGYFARCPTVIQVIDQGDEPDEDRPRVTLQ